MTGHVGGPRALRRQARTALLVLAVVTAAAAGLVTGGAAMHALQGGGDGPDRSPPTPDTVPASAAPLPEPAPDVLLAWTSGGLDPRLVAAAAAHRSVIGTSVVRGDVIDMVGSRDDEGRTVDDVRRGWAVPLDAVAIDPASHAPLVPVADRAAVAALRDGEALLGRTSANLRGLAPGALVELAGGRSVVVAGIVDDATIGGAELAVPRPTGERLGVRTDRYLLAFHDGDRAAVEAALRDALAGDDRRVRFRSPGETPFLRHGDGVLTQVQLKERFGEFSYRRRPGGGPDGRQFEQDAGWRGEHLVVREVPILGRVRCHRDVVDALAGALRELEDANLAGLVDPELFAGCWAPRLIRPGEGVSHHAWGVAVDLNYRDNLTGLDSAQDPRLVEVLRRWGFTWGGDWLLPDASHFEYRGPPAP